MIEWLFPAKCPVCMGVVLPRDTLIHPECEKKLPLIKEPLCMRCGRPLEEEDAEYCESCKAAVFRKMESWDSGRCTFFYQGEVKTALWKLKQEGTKEIVTFFGRMMAERHVPYLQHLKPDCVVPVPLHPFKERQRGFNQSRLLAEAVAKEFPLQEIPVAPLLKKMVRTADQKSLSGTERQRNLIHAFCFEEEYRGQIPHTVLLIDDVFTTGSTLAACAAILKKQGVKQIGFLCACFSAGGQ